MLYETTYHLVTYDVLRIFLFLKKLTISYTFLCVLHSQEQPGFYRCPLIYELINVFVDFSTRGSNTVTGNLIIILLIFLLKKLAFNLFIFRTRG